MIGAAILPRPDVSTVRRRARWLFAALVALCLFQAPALAQDRLVLEADNLVFDYEGNVISATGGVVIRYAGYVLNADRVTYYQTTGRLVAVGNVQIVDAAGNVYQAAEMDITDDFADGFIRELYVATADGVFFTAETAQRLEGRTTEFYNSTYTVCAPRPNERPPLWNVRARQITHDEEERMVYFRSARLEFFGIPVGFLPYLATPDPTVTRATGFLRPVFSRSSSLGFGISTPYFWAPAPNYDLTITPTYYRNAGFLGAAEWRHVTYNGDYTLTGAAIYQTKPGPAVFRGGFRTRGDFNLNRFWSFGWDGTLLSDRDFGNAYSVVNTAGSFVTSHVYLVGLKNQSFVELHAYHFRDVRSPSPRTDQARQAVVLPTLDHDIVIEDPVLGGEVRFTGNITHLSRGANDPFNVPGDPNTYFYGLAGTYTRISEEVSWRRELVGPLGQLFTPFAYARGDVYFLDLTAPPPGITPQAVAARTMAGIGLEWAWPILITMGESRHVVEPIVQALLRPSEQMIGALPNDDAQSLYFDTTNLLAWDRFTGFDRADGGARLAVALRYSGEFANARVEAMVGQSFHLSGINSVAVPDIHNTGFGTGLEAARSDLVASFVASGARGNSLALTGRFDGMTYDLQRGTVSLNTHIGPLTTSTGVAFDRSRLDLEGVPTIALVLNTNATLAIGPHWSLSGGLGYNFVTNTMTSDFIRLTYQCECASMSLTISETRTAGSPVVDRTILFGLELRTLGDFDITRRNN